MQHPAELPPMSELLVCLGTGQASVIRTLIDSIWSLTVQGNLLFMPSGFRICNVSPTHVTYVNLPAEKLDTYHYSSTRGYEPAGVDFAQLWPFLKTLGQKDTVYFYVHKRNINHLVILKCDESGSMTLQVPLLTIDEEIFERPPFEGDFFTITYPAARLQTALKEMRSANCTLVQFLAERGEDTDHLYISATGDDISMKVKRHDPIAHPKTMRGIVDCGGDSDSDDTESVDEAKLPPGSQADGQDDLAVENIGSIDDPTCDKSDQYSLTHLMYMVKAANMSPFVRIHLREHFPLLLSYTVGTLGQLFYAMAPKEEEAAETLETIRIAERRSAKQLGRESLADQQADTQDKDKARGRKRKRRQERDSAARRHVMQAKKPRQVMSDSESENASESASAAEESDEDDIQLP